jgi:dephospho-CoA kinase
MNVVGESPPEHPQTEVSPYVVAVTGGVASGKSTVTAMFEALGVPVVDADEAARAVVTPGSEGLAAVLEAFGSEFLMEDGSLDRARMRATVFADAGARRRLEAILHPRIRRHMHEQVKRMYASDPPPPYLIAAIPLLAEVGAYPWVSRVLVVDAPEPIQVERLMRRDGVDVDMARAMLAAQIGRDQRLALADDVIVNDADRDALESRVRGLHERYLQRGR